MSWWGGRCARCDEYLTLLFTSWYCPCEDDGSPTIGFAMISKLVYEDLDEEGEIPQGLTLHIFEEKSVAKEFAAAFLGFVVVQVDLSSELFVLWSTKEKLWVHEACSNLPCKVIL